MAWPLTPEAAVAVTAAERRPRPSVHLMPIEEGRRCYAEESAPLGDVPALYQVSDLHLDAHLQGRLYRPSARELPVVLFFHGGGWVLGNVDTHDQMCRTLAAESGCAILSVDYRLAPENPYPAAIEDAVQALAWINTHGKGHGLDPTRVAVAGDSAGGNLAVALAVRGRREDNPPNVHLLFYPVTTTDLQLGFEVAFDGLVLCREELLWHQDQYLPRSSDRRQSDVSPLDCADLAHMPPAVVIAAECDPILPQSTRYVDALRAQGVPAQLRVFEGMIHGFAQYPDRFRAAQAALRYAGESMADALKQQPATSVRSHDG